MSELNSTTILVGAELGQSRKPLRIPDFAERRRLADLSDRAKATGIKMRKVTRSCGHVESHAIGDGPWARLTYRALRSRPCGTCPPVEEEA